VTIGLWNNRVVPLGAPVGTPRTFTSMLKGAVSNYLATHRMLFHAEAHLRPMLITIPGAAGKLYLRSDDKILFVWDEADEPLALTRTDVADITEHDDNILIQLAPRFPWKIEVPNVGPDHPWNAWRRGEPA
jgi:hypothetical protein